VILTRSRLCPRPKPGSSLHLHVLSTPPAFVLSQDQTLREKCDVTGVSHKRVVMSLTRHRVHNAAADMTELSTPARCMMGRGRARATKDRASSVARCSVFKDHLAGSTGLAASPTLLRSRKGPLGEGPVLRGRNLGRCGLLLRGCSFRHPKQERPESIARDMRELGVAAPISGAQEGLANRRVPWVRPDQGAIRRAKRRFPTCRTLPESSRTGTSSRSGARLSPSSFTPP
jgi:hypothetical protein